MKKATRHIKKSASKQLTRLREVIFASTASTIVSIAVIVVTISGVSYAAYLASGQTEPSTPNKSTPLSQLAQSGLPEPASSSVHSSESSTSPDKTPQSSPNPSPTAKNSSSPQISTQPVTGSTAPSTPQTSTQCPYRAFDPYYPASPVRTNGSTTITYTVSFTIIPICASFGNPIIDITITNPLNPSYRPPCINSTSTSRRYNGNSSFTVSCVVTVTPPTDISQHYIAPLPSASGFTVNVSATLENGQIVNGGEGKIYYLDPGFDRL